MLLLSKYSEVLFAFNWSSPGHSHAGLLFINEDQKKTGSWRLLHTCWLVLLITLMMMMANSSQMRIWGRLNVTSCMLIGGCRGWFLMCRPHCTLNRWRFWLRMIGMLRTLSDSCVFPWLLHASLPWTYDWLFSLMRVNCLGLRPPASITDGWFLPVEAASSPGLCNAFLEHHDHAFFLRAHWRRFLLACIYIFHPIPCDMAMSPVQLRLKPNGLSAGQAGCLEDFFVWHIVCHLMPRMECKQCRWNHSSCLICF